MDTWLQGLMPICFGLLAIIARNPAARVGLELDYRILGVSVSQKWHEAGFVISGAIFILLGLLASAGVIPPPS